MNAPDEIRVGHWELAGRLGVVRDCLALTIVAHGVRSSPLSPRNGLVASVLKERGFGTLVFELRSASEAFEHEKVFDIALLAVCLRDAMDWIRSEAQLASQPLGLFAASTGAAAALDAAPLRPGAPRRGRRAKRACGPGNRQLGTSACSNTPHRRGPLPGSVALNSNHIAGHGLHQARCDRPRSDPSLGADGCAKTRGQSGWPVVFQSPCRQETS